MYSELFLAVLFTSIFAIPLLKRTTPSFSFAGDAPFTVDVETLSAAMTCPNGVPTASSPPVLLVHGMNSKFIPSTLELQILISIIGTATTGEETWGEGYVPALSADGYTPCYLTLRTLYACGVSVASKIGVTDIGASRQSYGRHADFCGIR